MRHKPLLLAILVLLLGLDWLALHDILMGEPDLRLEWAVVVLSGAVFALLVANLLFRRRAAGR